MGYGLWTWGPGFNFHCGQKNFLSHCLHRVWIMTLSKGGASINFSSLWGMWVQGESLLTLRNIGSKDSVGQFLYTTDNGQDTREKGCLLDMHCLDQRAYYIPLAISLQMSLMGHFRIGNNSINLDQTFPWLDQNGAHTHSYWLSDRIAQCVCQTTESYNKIREMPAGYNESIDYNQGIQLRRTINDTLIYDHHEFYMGGIIRSMGRFQGGSWFAP